MKSQQKKIDLVTRPAQKQAAAVNAGAALFGVETPVPAAPPAQVAPAAAVKSEPPKTLDTGAALFGVDSSVAAKAPEAQATGSGAALFGVDPQAASEAPKQPEVSGTGAALFGVDPSAVAKSEGSEVAPPPAAQATQAAGAALFGVEIPVAAENAVPEPAPAVNILLHTLVSPGCSLGASYQKSVHFIFQVDHSMPPPPPEATAPQTESKPPMQRLESADILPPAPLPAIPPAGDSSADDPLPAPPAEMEHISDKLTTGLATNSIFSVSFW